MADALDLGLTPAKVLSKMRSLRAKKASKFDKTIPYMEVVLGWNLDEMAASLIHAIKDERCRGPRCGRLPFRQLVTDDRMLELITCDILDPSTDPLWCMNVRWVCSTDNKGDGRLSMKDRAARLIEQRSIDMHLPNGQVVTVTQETLW